MKKFLNLFLGFAVVLAFSLTAICCPSASQSAPAWAIGEWESDGSTICNIAKDGFKTGETTYKWGKKYTHVDLPGSPDGASAVVSIVKSSSTEFEIKQFSTFPDPDDTTKQITIEQYTKLVKTKEDNKDVYTIYEKINQDSYPDAGTVVTKKSESN